MKWAMALLRALAVKVHLLRHQSAQQQQQHPEAASASISSSSSSNLPNYPRQMLGSYKALMHLLTCNRDSPAVDATTCTVSSASFATTAAVNSPKLIIRLLVWLDEQEYLTKANIAAWIGHGVGSSFCETPACGGHTLDAFIWLFIVIVESPP